MAKNSVIIDKFSSMTPRLRENTYDFALACHFNIFRNGTLLPNPSYITLTDSSEKVFRFVYAKAPSSAYALWGLGDDGAGKPQIFKLGLGDTAWTSVGAFSTGARATNVFFEYKDWLYLWQNGTVLSRMGLVTAGSPTFKNDYQLISYTNVAQPVHHKANDYAYFFVDNLIYRKISDAAALTLVLTLPDNMKIIGGASYGNYLAIVCSPLDLGATNSVMYLWDKDSSLVGITQKIDLGMGEAIHCSEAEDGGIWITQQARRTTGITSRNNYISVKYFNGYLETLNIPVGNVQDYFQSVRLTGNSFEERGIFYFPAELITTGLSETRNVIFASRRNGGRIELNAEQEITGVTANQNINGIYSVGGIWYVSYNTAAKTLQQRVASTYPTCTYESKIFNDGDSSLTKKLKRVKVATSALPAGASVLFYYRRDNETSWTLIFTHTAILATSIVAGDKYQIISVGSTDFTLIGASANTVGVIFTASAVGTGTGYVASDTISHTATNIESTKGVLPRYKEIQFKIESTIGAEITSFEYEPEFIDNNL